MIQYNIVNTAEEYNNVFKRRAAKSMVALFSFTIEI